MLLDHGAAQAQAQAHALVARGEKGREQLLRHMLGNAGAAVDDGELHPAAARAGGRTAHAQLQLALHGLGRVHGLHAVARQVEQHLLDHGRIAEHGREAGLDVGGHAHAQVACLQADQRQHGVYEFGGAYDFAGLVAPPHEIAHALDHAACAVGLEADALHGHAQVLQLLAQPGFMVRDGAARTCTCARAIVAPQHVQRSRGVAGDGHQRLGEFMAQQRGHLAHRGQAGRGLQALLRGA